MGIINGFLIRYVLDGKKIMFLYFVLVIFKVVWIVVDVFCFFVLLVLKFLIVLMVYIGILKLEYLVLVIFFLL